MECKCSEEFLNYLTELIEEENNKSICEDFYTETDKIISNERLVLLLKLKGKYLDLI